MGLTQLGARAYDATLGRFLSVDAVLTPFNPVQNNGYAYSGNSPITRSDPSGNYYVGGALGDCGDSGCSGSSTSSTGGTSGGKGKTGTPPAAGNGTSVAISPHVYDSSTDPRLKRLRSEYLAELHGGKVSTSVELNLWYLICENGGGCPSGFLSMLRRYQDSSLGSGPSAVQAAAAAGARFTIQGNTIAWADETGTTTLYRAVTPQEAEDIKKTGQFRNGDNGANVKYFTSTQEAAQDYARKITEALNGRDGQYSIVRTTVPNTALVGADVADVDGGIEAYVIPIANLAGVEPVLIGDVGPAIAGIEVAP